MGDGGSWEDMGVVLDSLSVVCLAWGFLECLLDMEGLASFRLHFVSLSHLIFLRGSWAHFFFLSFLFFSFYSIVFGGSGVLSQGADFS